MDKLNIYIDTSVWNFYFAEDAPEKKQITEDFFHRIEIYNIYISNIVIEEILQADENKKNLLLDLIKRYKPTVLLYRDEIKHLAERYLELKIMPEKRLMMLTTSPMPPFIEWTLY